MGRCLDSHPRRVAELALLFLRLGVTAFGGPAAHIALFEEEVVRRRGWLSREELLDLVGAANLIPGPNSTEVAIHIGYRRAGWAGLVAAGICFIVPAAAITLGLAWAYVRFGQIPHVARMLYGIKPVMIAVVLQALWGLGRTALKTRTLTAVGLAAAGAVALGVDELVVLLGAGTIAMMLALPPRAPGPSLVGLAVGSSGVAAASSGAVASFWPVFLVFAKIGSVLFGSGYVLLAFLRQDLVRQRQWLTEAQLVDAVAIGQLTPGPVFTTATFIGYLLDGVSGAIAATAGIFLPAFFFVAVSGLLLPRIRRSKRAGAFLDGVNVASLALMAVVSVQLGRASLVDAVSVAIGAASLLLLVRWKVSSVWLILGGAAIGLARP